MNQTWEYIRKAQRKHTADQDLALLIKKHRKLLEDGANPNCQDYEGNTPLLDLANSARFVRTKGKTPMEKILMAERRFSRINRLASLYLEKGADPNIKNNDGFGALHLAVLKGNSELVNLLLQYKALPNMRDRKNGSPILYAVMANHLVIVKTLHRMGASLEERYDNMSLLEIARFRAKGDSRYRELAEYLQRETQSN